MVTLRACTQFWHFDRIDIFVADCTTVTFKFWGNAKKKKNYGAVLKHRFSASYPKCKIHTSYTYCRPADANIMSHKSERTSRNSIFKFSQQPIGLINAKCKIRSSCHAILLTVMFFLLLFTVNMNFRIRISKWLPCTSGASSHNLTKVLPEGNFKVLLQFFSSNFGLNNANFIPAWQRCTFQHTYTTIKNLALIFPLYIFPSKFSKLGHEKIQPVLAELLAKYFYFCAKGNAFDQPLYMVSNNYLNINL